MKHSTRRRDIQKLFFAASAMALAMATAFAQPAPATPAVADVCVYGGTASGVMAAVAAKREGKSVIIVEPARALGGMIGGGIQVNQDTRHPGDIGGLTRLMMEKDIEIGGEPHENQPKFREALAELVKKHGITVLYHHRLGTIAKTGTKIEKLFLDYAPVEPDGCPAAKTQKTGAFQVEAAVFIDASYEGDLMALARVPYAVGREGRSEFNESLAGQRNLKKFDLSPYVIPGDSKSGLLPMIDPEPFVEGGASRHIMAYNFRPRWVPAGQGAKVGAPSHYDPANYELVLRALRSHPEYVGWPSANYARGSLISGGIPGRQSDYPDGTWEVRSKIWREWIDHVKIMHQLTGSTQELKKGEYPDSVNDFPDQLYVRLGRRMRGEYVITQHDLMLQTDVEDSIGLGYGWVGWTDIYPTRIIATADGKVATEGESNATITPGPYRISYRAMVPKAQSCTNLIVPVCASSTHIAMSSIRMEGTWMLMGESAGIAAAQSLNEKVAVQKIDQGKYRARLRQVGQILEWDGTGYGGGASAWWNKHPEDYQRHPVATLRKGPREESEFVKRVEADQRGKRGKAVE